MTFAYEPDAANVPADAHVAVPALGLRHHALALSFALVGGLFGIVAAVAQEVQGGGLFVFLAAGVMEEAAKPAGIYILLLKWPHVLRGRIYRAVLTAISGLVFALVEAAVYIFVYVPDGSDDFVTYRLTVPLAMHTVASFIFGLGIRRELIDWANGVARFPRDSLRFMTAAMTLHGGFNLVVVVLAVAGVLDFE